MSQDDLLSNELNVRLYSFTSASIGASSSSSLNQKDFTLFRRRKKYSAITFANKVRLLQCQVVASASTDFDFSVFPTDGFTSNEELVSSVGNDLVSDVIIYPDRGVFLFDEDETRELHIKLVNDDVSNASTFKVKLWVVVIEE